MQTCGTDCADFGTVMGIPATFMTTVAAASIHPTQTEVCNGVDDDCNGMVDDSVMGGGLTCSTSLLGVCAAGTERCVSAAFQCVQTTMPSTEVCDGLDNNCNGMIDEGVTVNCFRDADGDGFGDPATLVTRCACGVGFVTNGTDRYDNNVSAYPGQTMSFTAQRGDGSFDYNCDGTTTVLPTSAFAVPVTQTEVNAPCGGLACVGRFWRAPATPACGTMVVLDTCRPSTTLGNCIIAGVSQLVPCR